VAVGGPGRCRWEVGDWQQPCQRCGRKCAYIEWLDRAVSESNFIRVMKKGTSMACCRRCIIEAGDVMAASATVLSPVAAFGVDIVIMGSFRMLRLHGIIFASAAFGLPRGGFFPAARGASTKRSAQQRRKPFMRESVVVASQRLASIVDVPRHLSLSITIATATTADTQSRRPSCAMCQIVPRARWISPRVLLLLRDVALWPAAARTSSHRYG
jgi:hypothetical protein